MFDRIKNTIIKYNMLQKGDSVLVAVSGGPDSMALLHVLYLLKDEYELSLSVLHLNHCLRGIESKFDERLVRKTVSAMGLPFYLEVKNIRGMAEETHQSIETCARNERQRLYQKYAEENNIQKIALGHNEDDQLETILMRFIRGAGVRGFCGISPVRGKIIRPLLEVPKAEITAYCDEKGWEYRNDLSNLDTIYLRNKIRLEFLPMLEFEYNKNMRTNLLRQREIAIEDNEYWQKISQKTLEKCLIAREKDSYVLDCESLRKEERSVIKRVLMTAIENLKGNLLHISFHDLNAVTNFIFSESSGKVNMHSQAVVEKSCGQIRVSLFEESEQENDIYLVEFLHVLPDVLEEDKIYVPLYNKGEIQVRYREPGDKIKTAGGTKKLKKLLNEKQIPIFQRNRLQVVAQGDEVLWLEGYGNAYSEEPIEAYAVLKKE